MREQQRDEGAAVGKTNCGGRYAAVTVSGLAVVGLCLTSWAAHGEEPSDETVLLQEPPSITVSTPDPVSGEEPYAARQAAADAWNADGTNGTATALFAAYFGEIPRPIPDVKMEASDVGAQLGVTIPWNGPYGLQITTRGLSFDILRESPEMGNACDIVRDYGVFCGPRHGWAMSGRTEQKPAVESAGLWTTDRVEEFRVVDESAGKVSGRAEVVVPREVVAVRDTGDYLEFRTAKGESVLRYHYAVASDRKGERRWAQTRLTGVAPTPTYAGPFPLYALRDSLLVIDYSVDLTAMDFPVVVDPGWSSTASMGTARNTFMMALLPSTEVLAAGGYNPSGFLSACELYSPQGTWGPYWHATGSMQRARYTFNPTNMPLLPNGKVLWVGIGPVFDPNGVDSAEVYNPVSGTWTLTGSVGRRLDSSTFVKIESGTNAGKVLALGGNDASGNPVRLGNRYDWATNAWTPIADMWNARRADGAAALHTGKVMVGGGAALPTELYDPQSNTWVTGPTKQFSASGESIVPLPNAKILALGQAAGADPEIYDPTQPPTGSWSPTNDPSSSYRRGAVAVRLKSGVVVRFGGLTGSGGPVTSSAEKYDWQTNNWTSAGSMSIARDQHRAVLLSNNKILVCGGQTAGGPQTNTCELYVSDNNPWTAATSMLTARWGHTATKLPDGRILVTGGRPSTSVGYLNTAEFYIPSLAMWIAAPPMATARTAHTATLIQGKVVVTGGQNAGGLLNSVEMYDPATNMWTPRNPMSVARSDHVASMTNTSYKMMVASGNTGEILNANTNTWANIGNNAPGSHGFGATASQLTTGVLVIGGWGAGIHFDLLRNSPMTWAPDGTVPWDGWDTRGHSATQVGTGAILKVGGGENDYPGHWVTNAASLYYTSSNEWTAMPYAAYPRSSHTGTLLPTWKILIAGGWNYSTPPTYSEVFDYATELWVPSLQATMVNPRYGHTAALLDSGQVLVTGGRLNSNGQVTATAELYAEPAQ